MKMQDAGERGGVRGGDALPVPRERIAPLLSVHRFTTLEHGENQRSREEFLGGSSSEQRTPRFTTHSSTSHSDTSGTVNPAGASLRVGGNNWGSDPEETVRRVLDSTRSTPWGPKPTGEGTARQRCCQQVGVCTKKSEERGGRKRFYT